MNYVEFPKNCMWATRGRLVELCLLQDRLMRRSQEWKAMYNRTYNKKLTEVRKKVEKHCLWYSRTKYPDMPPMGWFFLGSGVLFYPFEVQEHILNTRNFNGGYRRR